MPCVPIILWVSDRDYDEARFIRLVSLPQFGFLTTEIANRSLAVASASVETHGEPAAIVTTAELYPVLTWNSLYNQTGGWATALPAPPLPDDVPRDCFPRCRVGLGTCPDSGDYCPDCRKGLNGYDCPEGGYQQASVACYIPFQTTYTGPDNFQWAAIDLHGAQSATATVGIEICDGWRDLR
jgi:hypothetical protein